MKNTIKTLKKHNFEIGFDRIFSFTKDYWWREMSTKEHLQTRQVLAYNDDTQVVVVSNSIMFHPGEKQLPYTVHIYVPWAIDVPWEFHGTSKNRINKSINNSTLLIRVYSNFNNMYRILDRVSDIEHYHEWESDILPCMEPNVDIGLIDPYHTYTFGALSDPEVNKSPNLLIDDNWDFAHDAWAILHRSRTQNFLTEAAQFMWDSYVVNHTDW